MANKNNRHVVPSGNPDKPWAVRKPGSDKASSLHSTQQDAIDRGRQTVTNLGGGELVIHRPNGQIRDSDTVPPGNDPCPPIDKK